MPNTLSNRNDLQAIAKQAMDDGATYAILASILNRLRIPALRNTYWSEDSAYNLCRNFDIRSQRPHNHQSAAETQKSTNRLRLETAITEAINARELTLKEVQKAPVARIARILGIGRHIVSTHREDACENVLSDIDITPVSGSIK